jgi:Domain of unknown function (DUF4192)
MTTTSNAISLSDPASLLETLPYLLGFHPTASVVLVGLRDSRVVVTTRIDLTDASDAATTDADVHILTQAGVTMAIAAIYAAPGDRSMRSVPTAIALPHEHVVESIAGVLARHDVTLVEAFFVQAEHWWSYSGWATGCPDCIRGDRLPGAAATGPAEAVFAGLQALPNREALLATIEQDPWDVREQHRTGIEAAVAVAARAGSDTAARQQRSVKRALFAAAREADRSLFPRALPDIATPVLYRYAAALGDIAIRDSLWLAVDQNRLDGRAFWLQLLARLPAPYDSPALFLFGWATWRDGNGTLAAMAAERALSSRVGYTAAELLLSAVQTGLDPFRTPRLRMPNRG